MSVEAMKQALEALDISASCTDAYYIPLGKSMIPEVENAITTLHQAIEQSEKREWVGLTDEEILNLYTGITKSAWDCIMYARVIEARLKGMNHEPRQYKDLCGND